MHGDDYLKLKRNGFLANVLDQQNLDDLLRKLILTVRATPIASSKPLVSTQIERSNSVAERTHHIRNFKGEARVFETRFL